MDDAQSLVAITNFIYVKKNFFASDFVKYFRIWFHGHKLTATIVGILLQIYIKCGIFLYFFLQDFIQ